MYFLVSLLGEGGACGTKVAGFSAAKAELFLNTARAFFWSELGDLDRVYDHGVGVVGLGGRGERMVGLMGGPRVPLGNVVGALPLGLKSDGLLVPFVDGRGNSVHGHDAAHERGWNPCREISNQDVGVGDIGEGDVVFERGNIFRQRGGVRIVLLLLHSLSGKPGDGVPGDIVVFECSIELCDEVGKGPKGERGSRDGALAKGCCPGKGRPFCHVRKSKGDLFIVIIIDCFVNKEVKLHSVQPVL